MTYIPFFHEARFLLLLGNKPRSYVYWANSLGLFFSLLSIIYKYCRVFNSVVRYMETFSFFTRYFPADATAEMLEEWRPLMCPFDVTMQKAVSYFEIFLPTSLPPELHHKGFK